MSGKIDINVELRKEVIAKENELRDALKRLRDAQGEDLNLDNHRFVDTSVMEKDQEKQPELGQRSLSNVSLPSIDHILKSIDSYQTQQQLQDSQLLLELTQRPSQTSFSSNEDAESSRSDVRSLYSNSNSNSNTTGTLPSVEPSSHHHHPMMVFTADDKKKISSTHQDEISSIHQFNDINERKDLKFRNEDPSLHKKKKSNSRRESTTVSPLTPKADNNGNIEETPPSRQSSVESIDSQSGSNTPNSTSSNNNKKRTNLPRETIDILNEWILNNMDNPYPNHTQKRYLLEKTGLSNVQLSNWFINKRRRRIFSNLSGNNGQPIKKKRLIDRI